ncbi:MAG: CDP-alcohol phosphatidyltransferase family protein, partial [Candidatus Methanofastidiosia archaeon]
MLARYRKRYQQTFLGVGKFVAKSGISPNILTIFSLLPAAVSAYFFYKNDVLMGLAFILITSFVDVLDGSVARAAGKTSLFGKVLDHSLDRYVEFIIIGGIALGGLATFPAVLFALSGMMMASYIRAKAEGEGAKNCDIGIMDRAEKMIILMIGCLLFAKFE